MKLNNTYVLIDYIFYENIFSCVLINAKAGDFYTSGLCSYEILSKIA